MIAKDVYCKFYNACVPVKGSKRGVIYDLQRGYFYFIPNSVIDMLLKNKNNKLSTLYAQYKNQKELVDKYLNFLIDNEIIFLTEEPFRFPSLDLNFRPPFLLDILFIEIDTLSQNKIDLLKKLIH